MKNGNGDRMRRHSFLNILILVTCIIIYIIIRADAWRLLVASENAAGVISRVNEMNSDPHTTSLKVRVDYTFTSADGKIYHGSGDRVLKDGENTENLSWLTGTGIDIVYISTHPEINDVSGREYAVLFPLVLIPFVILPDILNSRRSRLKT